MDHEIDTKEFIEQELLNHNIFHRVKQNDFATYCPFYAHEGNTLLLQIRFDGVIHCWGCGTAGHYNQLAEKIGLKKLPNSTQNGYGAFEQQLRSVPLEHGLPALPKGLKPFEDPYRGLSVEFLKRYDSQRWYDPDSCGWRILWPITHNGKLQGYTAGRIDNELFPKYVHGPTGAIRTRHCLFPIDDPLIGEVVVLCEGPFSALRLLNLGIPAVSILGATNWHSSKVTMLRQRRQPVRGIIVAVEPDSSGEAGADKILEATKDHFEEVESFYCPLRVVKEEDAETGEMRPVYLVDPATKKLLRDENGELVPKTQKTDPGDMPMKYVERLRTQLTDMQARLKPKRAKRKKLSETNEARSNLRSAKSHD